MPIIIQKEIMRKLVIAAQQLIVIKDLILRSGELTMLLVVIQEDMEKISDIMDRLIVKRLILEEYIETRIQRSVESYPHELLISKIYLPYQINYITKKQLEDGYINLTSTHPDGEDHVGDYILYLTTGDIAPLHLPRRTTRSVSYYAFFKGWLLLSQPPDCLCLPTSFPT